MSAARPDLAGPGTAASQLPVLRRLPVPDCAPRPFESTHRSGPGRADQAPTIAPTQGTLALALPVPEPADDGPDGMDRDHHGPDRAGPDGSDGTDRNQHGQVLPEPRAWAAQFVRAAIEVSAGVRPPSQLVRWTSDDVQRTLVRRSLLAARAARAARLAGSAVARPAPACRALVRSARICRPGPGIVEAGVVISDGHRARAVALRLEGLDGRWRVTALEIG